MRFHVLHSPLGTLLAYHLRQTLPKKHGVSLIYHNNNVVQKQITSDNTVRVEHAGAIMTARNVDSEHIYQGSPPRRKTSIPNTKAAPVEDEEQKPIESLIVAIPPAFTRATLNTLIHRLSPQSTIVLMQPGLGVYEKLITTLFTNPTRRPHFIIASPRHDAWLKQPNHVVHSLAGSIDFSIVPDSRGRDYEAILRARDVPPQERGLRLTDITSKATDREFEEYASLRNTVSVLSGLDALNVTWLPMEEGEIVFRRDLVVRAVTDALGVTLGLPNGELLSTVSSRKLTNALLTEIVRAFKKQWYTELGSHFQHTDKGLLPPMPALPRGLGKRDLMGALVRHLILTKEFNAPMLRDIEAGSQTHLQYGLGYLCRIGRAYGVPMPTTVALYQTIKARESVGLLPEQQ